ncbi:diguanylate cyclase [Actinoplanes sp. NPDC051861]|uniref:diguanylate cyclase domain-containing protein n=1 Tax=Actinoplanes sp. NPDC051861 TaxID=3155170 RepID=UPI00341FEF36
MVDQTSATPADRDAALEALLAEHPGAIVGATTSLGLFVPLPDEMLSLGLRSIQGGSSALSLIVPDDHTKVAEAWIGHSTRGWASTTVRPLTMPDQEIGLHFVDTTHRFGVVTVLISGLAHLSGGGLDYERPRPRMVTMRKDQVAKVIDADPAIGLVLGWEAADLIGNSTLDLVHPDDRGRAVKSWMDLMGAPAGEARRVRLRHLHRDGEVIWFEITNHNRLEGDDPHVLAEMLDITDEMAAQEALRASEQLLRRLAETLPLGVVQIDTTGHVVYRNTRYAHAAGQTGGDSITDVLRLVVPADRPMVEEALAAVLGTGDDTDIEYGYRHEVRGLRRISASLRALTDDAGAVTGAIICFTDVTEDVRLREQLRQQATYDTLTGCHNRAATLEALEDRAAAGRGVAVIFLDLNEFKQVNDRLGHFAGDQLLIHVAGRLRTAVRHDDVVGRLGGDEFVVICRDVPDAGHARRIGETMVEALANGGLELAGEWVQPAASIGAAWSRGLSDPDALIARADAAMYTAKKARTGRLALVMAE